jgi:M6 family metalloprotease-like protein
MCGIFGEIHTLGQENGPDVELVVFGDESYARHETKDGYTVVYDGERGLFCYAALRKGRFVSTGESIDGPPPADTRRHLKESEAVRNAAFERRFALRMPPSDGLETFGANKGLLTGRQVNKGKVRGLTVIVEFSDVKAAVTVEQVRAMCNDPGYSTNGNNGSVRDYFLTMSGGLLDYTNDVVGPVKLKQKRSFYHKTLLVKEAMDAVVAMGVDLSLYDSLNQGVIDAINFLYAGPSQFVNDSNLWPHNHFIQLKYGGLQTNFYLLTGLGTTAADLRIGTMCHENGHLLCRFPDMYDYGERDGDFEKSAGIGTYCLMGAGNHLNDGRTPSAVSAYLRDLAGWCTRTVSLNQGGRFEAKAGDYATLMRFSAATTNEYFLVENRFRAGHNAHLPSSGLAVYHCDTNGSNEWQGGTATKHYQCGLLQADGHLELETNANLGNAGDLFGKVAGTALSHATKPSTNQWDGAESGLVISQIDAPGAVIAFVVGTSAPQSTDEVVGQAAPGATIPDANPTGVVSVIPIARGGTVRDLRVEVDITHPYVSDLLVELVGPTGQRAALHNRAGGDAIDLRRTFDTTSAPGLSSFVGLGVQGDWMLRVSDLEAADVGKLNRWVITIEVDAPATAVARAQAAPNLSIPDAKPAGVASRIAMPETGVVREVRATVGITHTYIGDLVVKLTSPSGRSAVLHNRTGASADNIQMTYDAVSAPALASFAGEAVHGDWTLHVADHESIDTGKLVRWELEITYAPAGPEHAVASTPAAD